MLSNLYDKIVGQRSTLESVVSKIPGFRGYMEMASRREADRMMREHVARQYEALLNRFANIEKEVLRSPNGLMVMDKSKSIRTRLETLRRRIATDVPGYSGFFAANKIGPEDLQNVYAFDEAMLRYVDDLTKKFDNLANALAAGEDLNPPYSELDTLVMEALQAYDLRDDVLKKIS